MFSYAAKPEPSGLFVIVTGLVALVALAVVAVAWRKLGQHPGHAVSGRQRRRFASISALFLVPVLIGTSLIYNRLAFDQWYTGALGPTSSQIKAQQASLALNQEIVSEGSVLLKNDGTLPLMASRPIPVNVFGMGAVAPQYTTSLRGGDPRVNPHIVTCQEALLEYGLEPNPDLLAFYESQLPEVEDKPLYPLPGDKGEIVEVPVASYRDLLEDAVNYSDIAIVVVTRQGGEGGDLHLRMGEVSDAPPSDVDKHYLELQSVEMELLEQVTKAFDKVIVLVNAANQMELGFLDNPDISAALWIGEPGDNGFLGVASLLSGKTNPSGRLADTYAYNAESAPSYANFGDFRYLGEDGDEAIPNRAEARSFSSYVDYEEGIYVGYRYYETRWADVDGRVDENQYWAQVQYPFGFGLSYSTFSQEMTDLVVDSVGARDAEVRLQVKVTNQGELPGREVVQIYAAPPYHQGGIEKSRVVLAAFGKTELLQPGDSELLHFEFPLADLASYDEKNHQAWVLEEGEYGIALQSDAHRLIEEQSLIVPQTLVYRERGATEATDDVLFVGERPQDVTAATNRFGAVAGNDIIELSRADWSGTEPEGRRDRKVADSELLAQIADMTARFPQAEDDHGGLRGDLGGDRQGERKLVLSDMTGLPADDEQWERYLDQFSPEELIGLVGLGGWVTDSIPSQGVPRSYSVDGPVGVVDYVTGTAGIGFASSVVLASTFDAKLAAEFGQVLGEEAAAFGYQGLYSPGVNLHRSPFGGRNFEYFSEDPVLTGQMGVNVVRGYGDAGIYAHVKHFAVNEQETNRAGVATWVNEQALRELYLRPFQMAVQEGGAQALMGSYNRLGTTWTGADRELNVGVLRDEWGFEGHLVTDFFDPYYMDPDQAIAGGIDLIESTGGDYPSQAVASTTDGLAALRTSARHVLHTFANSAVVETREPFVKAADVVAIVIVVAVTGVVSISLITLSSPSKKENRKS